MGHIKVIVGVLSTCEGIGAACVLAEELAVFVLLRIFFCSQEQHVLTKVSQA